MSGKRRVKLKEAGRTVVGTTVVTGVYRFFETHGLPLDVLVDGLRERGYMPAWETIVDDTVAAGMERSRAISKVLEAASDVYGARFASEVEKRLIKEPPA